MCLPRVELSCRRVAVQAPDVVGVPSAAGQRGRVVRSQPPGPPRCGAAAESLPVREGRRLAAATCVPGRTNRRPSCLC